MGVTKVITKDVGTPLWFTVLIAILVTISTISLIGIFAATSKVKKGSDNFSKGNCNTPNNV